jgi:hypothetical protein
VRDYWWAPRHAALDRLLDGTLRFEWKPGGGDPGQSIEEAETAIWDGLGDGPSELLTPCGPGRVAVGGHCGHEVPVTVALTAVGLGATLPADGLSG